MDYINKKNMYKATRLLNVHKSIEENGNVRFDYALGEYGDILLQSKRYSDILPIDIIRLSYQRSTAIYIALYLSRLIYINKRKRSNSITITINSLLENVMIHDRFGKNTGKTLRAVLDEPIPNKYTYMNIFRKHLKYVLELLIRDSVIESYQVMPQSLEEIRVCNYEKGKLQIVLKK